MSPEKRTGEPARVEVEQEVDFGRYLTQHQPAVVIFDITPPYKENWQFFKTMRDSKAITIIRITPASNRNITASMRPNMERTIARARSSDNPLSFKVVLVSRS